MPKWLLKQLKEAYMIKDRRQIKYLNECWLSCQNMAHESPQAAKMINSHR